MEKIITNNFIILQADISDLEEFKQIEEECNQYFSFDPQCEDNHSVPIKECLTTGDLPPGGTKENYYFFGIRQDNELIGFMAYYLGYPEKDIAYLSVLYIGDRYRKNGIGSEIVNAVVHKLKAIGINEIRLHVSLRNVTALHFWVKQQFDKIVKVECTGNLISSNFAGIELQRKLS